MATISQRISIEGGDDIRKQFAELAKAAAASFQKIQDAAEKVQIDPASQKSFEELVGAGSKLADQFAELAKAAAETAPELEQVGKSAATTGEAFAKVGEQGTKAAASIAAVGDASTKSGDAAEKSST